MTEAMSQRTSYGWVVLFAAFVIVTLSIGTLFTLAVFLEPMERSLGWSRTSLSAVGFVNWIVMGLGGVAAGLLSDRFGTRVVVLGGSLLLGLGLFLSAHVQALWQFYLTFGFMVGGGVSAFLVPLTVTAIKWFEHRRAMAAAVISAGNGVGVLVLSPLSRWLINAFDWRAAFVVLGDLAWLVVIPTAFLLRSPPPPAGAPRALAIAGGSGGPLDMTLGGIWRSWPFWAIALTHFGCCAAHSGPIFHMVSHAIDQGVAKLTAAAILGLSGFTSVFGRVGAGLMADRIGAKRALIGALGFQAVTIISYPLARDGGSLTALGLAFGVGYGAAMPLYAVIAREYFGDRILGSAYGSIFFISCIGMGLGSYAGGVIHDTLGSYFWLFIGSFAIGTAAAILAITLQPPALAAARALGRAAG
jgi:MFS family permease